MPPKRKDGGSTNKQSVNNNKQDNLSASDDEVDHPVCYYDGQCYRKNPQHFKDYKHPKQNDKILQSNGTDDSTSTKKPKKKTGAIGYASSSSSSSSSSSDSSSEDYQPAKKKQKVTKDKSVPAKKATTTKAKKPAAAPAKVTPATAPAASSTMPSPAATSTKPNPPKLTKQSSLSNIINNDSNQDTRDELTVYRNLLHNLLSLSGSKISSDIKKLLLKSRKDNNITDEEHKNFLGMIGWTPDEYEIGEKQQEEVELQEEHEVLQDPNGFKIIEITSTNHMASKETETVWSKASAKFFQTMKKAQGNYKIEKISVIVNTKLFRQFQQKQKEFSTQDSKSTNDGKLSQIQWGFHGSTPTSIRSIAKEGFKHPDELKAAKGKKSNKSKVSLLDEGFFGKGIYFSCYSDYAMWYAEERNSNEILLCCLLPGRTYQCTKRMDGEDKMADFDSHYSPKGNEIIVFESAQILPRYILQFAEEAAEEREQED